MWTDSLQARDPVKLKYLAQCAQAAYEGTLAAAIGDDADSLTQILAPPLPAAWHWRKQGERIVLIAGTTYTTEYLFQVDGYTNPVSFAGGLVNSYYRGVANEAFVFGPPDAKVVVGHSMGGAAAQLCARMYRDGGQPGCFAVTFGAPKPWEQGHPAISATDINLRMANDPVPHLATDGFAGRNWRASNQVYLLLPGIIQPVDPQLPSTAAQIALIFATLGDSRHAIAGYAEFFTQFISTSPETRRRRRRMAEFFKIDIRGALMGQAANNSFWVVPNEPEPADVDDIVNDMRDFWRQKVLPRLSDELQILSYSAKKLSSLIWRNPEVGRASGSLFRFTRGVRIAGTNTDWGRRSGDVMPSFVAVGMAKSCEGYQDKSFTDQFILDAKLPGGGLRFPGVVRADVNVDLNTLEPSAVTSWTAVANEMHNISINGNDYVMVVITNTNGGIRLNGVWQPTYIMDIDDDIGPGFNVSRVTGLVLNHYITSQVSRKQTPHNLG